MELTHSKTHHQHLLRFVHGILGAGLIIYLLFKIDLPEDLIYYTYQTNLLCAVWLLLAGVYPTSWVFKNPIKGAVVSYITITALVYNTILLPYEVNYRGFVSFNSILTHMVIPGIMILDYLLSRKSGSVRWRTLLLWMAYPMAYLILVLSIGRHTGFYPYGFINPDIVNNSLALLRNYLALFLLHLIVGAIYLAISRWKHNKNNLGLESTNPS